MNKKVNSKQEGSKERILRVAVKLFASQGYGATGMRELASSAGVNLAMINYFFGSKKGLLKEILADFLAGYIVIAERELRGEGSLQAKLERFIQAAIIFFDGHKDALLVTINELPHDDPEILEHKAAWAKRMMAVINMELCTPMEAEGGSVVPPTVLGPLLTSTMASRFLFAPVMDHVRPEGHETESLADYSQMISRSLVKIIL